MDNNLNYSSLEKEIDDIISIIDSYYATDKISEEELNKLYDFYEKTSTLLEVSSGDLSNIIKDIRKILSMNNNSNLNKHVEIVKDEKTSLYTPKFSFEKSSYRMPDDTQETSRSKNLSTQFDSKKNSNIERLLYILDNYQRSHKKLKINTKNHFYKKKNSTFNKTFDYYYLLSNEYLLSVLDSEYLIDMDNMKKILGDRYSNDKSKAPMKDLVESKYYEMFLQNNLPVDDELYFYNLFIQYCSFIGKSTLETVSYLKQLDIKNYKTLINLNPEFLDFIKYTYKLRQFYMNHMLKIGINLNGDDIIELNKGQYDTCVLEKNKRISRHNSTINLDNSIIYRYKDKVYEVFDNSNVCEIPEGSTYIVHNPYNLFEVLYTLETLAGTDNNVVLGSWGLTIGKDRSEKLDKMIELLDALRKIGVSPIASVEKCVIDNVYCDSIVINTKDLKQIIDYDTLLTESDYSIIHNNSEFDDNKVYKHRYKCK